MATLRNGKKGTSSGNGQQPAVEPADFGVPAPDPSKFSMPYSRDEVEDALHRILASDSFVRSERLTHFLSYVVHKTLNSESADLKEYHLGVEVCGRKDRYDPRTDPVVRVEARRLRAALALYYAHEGAQDPLQIALPKGGYIPSFLAREPEQQAAPDPPENPTLRIPLTRQKWLTLAALALFAVAGTFAIAFLWNQKRARQFGDASTLVLSDFTNTTGEPIFDHALRQGLAAQLEQSPYLSLLSEAQVAQTLALMGKPNDTRLTVDLAREVCERTGKSVVIDGSIAPLGAQYILGLNAINCHTGERLATEQVQANGKEHVLEALAKGAAALRHKLGESLASVKKYDAPPESVTTPSLEALQAYSLGFQVHVVKLDESAAADLFQRAITIDPNFAMAYARLAVCNINLGELGQAAENLRKANELSPHISEHERLFILSLYHQFVTGDLEETRKTYELRAQIFPYDDIPIGNAGNVYFLLGQYDKALDATQEAIRRNPGSRIWNGNLVISYLSLGRYQEAKNAAAASKAHQLDSPWLHINLYLIAFEEGNSQTMAQEAAQVKGGSQFEDLLLYYQAQAKAREGKLLESRALSQRAAQMAISGGQLDTASLYTGQAAVNEAWAENRTQARLFANQALQISSGREGEAVAGIAFAIAGDSTNALRIAADLSRRFPQNTLIRDDYVPTIRAAAALYGNSHTLRPDEIVSALASAAPLELGSHAMERVAFLTCYPIYFRGEAYLAAHQPALAATEFQRILDHPQLTLTDPVSTMATLGLARASEMSGDRPRGAALRKTLPAPWKFADASSHP